MIPSNSRGLVDTSRTPSNNLRGLAARRVSRLAGRVPSGRRHQLESLEGRVLLAGDHSSFSDFPNVNAGDILNLNLTTGAGSLDGIIETAGSDDLFRFTVPGGAGDFVTIRADAQNSGSALNTRLDLYVNNNGTPVLVKGASGDGTLTAGTPTDAWIGFVAAENTDYFVRVSSDTPVGPGSTGAYVLRVDRISEKPAVNTAALTNSLNGVLHPATDAPGTVNPILGTIPIVGADIVYKLVIPTGHPEYDGIVTFNLAATTAAPNRLDTRLDVYDQNGQPVTVSSPPGRLNDAFSFTRATQGQTYFIRARSDEFLLSRANVGTGGFVVSVDVGAKDFMPTVDTVTRRAADFVAAFPVLFQSNLYRFTAQSSGSTIISAIPAGLAPVLDPALRLIDSNGNLIAFNNNFAGASPQIVATLTGGQTYYIVVDGFDVANTGLSQYSLFVEAGTTFNTNGGLTADDHPNTPTLNQSADSRRTFEAATPLVWGSPFLIQDSATNFIQDSGWLSSANGWGRIHQAGDVDLFSFTPQLDLQGTYTGSNDDNGTSLYLGGSFAQAGTVTANIANTVNGIAAWDAGDYWPARLGLNGSVFAMATYTAPGTTQPILFVGGNFTTATNGLLPTDIIAVNGLAAYAFDPSRGDYFWFSVGLANPLVVRALSVVDLPDIDGTGPGGDLVPSLYIGGDFGAVLAWDGTNLTQFATVANTGGQVSVRAITQYIEDLADPDDTVAGNGDIVSNPGADPAATVAMAIGGSFTGVGVASANVTASNIAKFGSSYSQTNATFGWQRLGAAGNNGVNGVVNALLAYDPPDPDGNGTLPDPPPGLIVGGAFTTGTDNTPSTGTTTLNFIGYWDGGWAAAGAGGSAPPANWVGTTLGYRGWNAMAGGMDGAVNALAVWDPADPDGAGGFPDLPEFIVAGGAFNTAGGNAAGHVAAFDFAQLPGNQGWAPLGPFGGMTTGAVNSLIVLSDTDAGISEDPLLYAGGSFTDADGLPANRMARFEYNAGVGTFVWNPMAAVANAGPNTTNPFPTENGVSGTVFAMAVFDDGNPNFWDRNDRPAARVNIVVQPDFEGFANLRVRLYDSNFNLIYTNTNLDTVPWSSELGIGSTFPFDTGRAGGLDPSRVLPGAQINALTLPPMWAGERYYLEVSIDAGVGVGRYSVNVTADARPPLVPTPDTAPNGGFIDPPQAGDFANATFLGTSPTTGDQTTYVTPINQAPMIRTFKGGASAQSVAYLSEFGNIYDLNETDLYYFRAEASGFVEVRLSTFSFNAEFTEFINGDPTTQTRTFESPLDGALRIFDGDFTQIDYNNDFPGVTGDPGDPAYVGTLNPGPTTGTPVPFTFTRRDPRVVFPVVEGEFYYIQVENGQTWVDGSPEDPNNRTARLPEEVDWRHANGAYQLLLNAMSDLDPVSDDHSNNTRGATPLPIAYDPANAATNGKASAVGTINDATDNDVFTFVATARGTVTLTVQRSLGSTVIPDVGVFDRDTALITSGTASSNGSITLQFSVRAGEQFYINILGSANTTGGYTLAMSGIPYADDFADLSDLPHASIMTQYDFLGSGEVVGSLEQPGDTDVFRFLAEDYKAMTLRVESQSAQTLNPYVTIYEVNVDPLGHPLLQRIAFNDNISGTDLNAQAAFAPTPGRVYGPTGQAFPYYYVVVSGSDPTVHYGNYKLTLTFPANDDHPDAGQYNFASPISVDSASGLGSLGGVTEKLTDSDLFQFVAPAGGQASVIVNRPSNSTALPKVTIIRLVSGAPVVLATGTASEPGGLYSPANSGEFTVTRNSTYYVLVENTAGRFGAYSVSVTAPAIDDYPNEGEFTIAPQISLNPTTGDGAVGTGVVGELGNPVLSPDNDTDLLYFIPVKSGPVTVTLISYESSLGRFAPRLRLFDTSGTLVPGADVSTTVPPSSNAPSVVTFTFPNGVQGQKYYVLVGAVTGQPPPATLTGEYRLDVNTTSGTGGGDPGSIDFNNPTAVGLNARTGDGQFTDVIEVPGDRDLFRFTIPQGVKTPDPVFVQVVTASGAILDATLTILNAPSESSVVTSDAAGIPGATAAARFNSVPGDYYAIVSGVGTTTGAYTIRINSEPKKQYLYFPEGFRSDAISEFISISNNNAFDVTYSVIAYYEDINNALPPTVIVNNGTIAAGARSGVTTSDPQGNAFSGIRKLTPYSLVIESNAPLGATLAHYDFGSTVGEAFTETLASTWTFGRVQKDPGAVEDYVLYFNPNPFTVTVDIVAYTSAGAVTIDLPVIGGLDLNDLPANRRFGLSIKDLPLLPSEIMGLTLTARAKDSVNNAAFAASGIVAALSHYDIVTGAGYGIIGNAQGGSTIGAAPSLTNGDTVTGEIILFNPNATTANVTVNRNYINPGFDTHPTGHTIAPRSVLVLTGSNLQLINNQAAGITYSSNVPVIMTTTQAQLGDADATASATFAATNLFLSGDGFINTELAGSLYFETVNIYNPTNAPTTVVVKLLFTGTTDFLEFSVPVAARAFAQLRLHEATEIIINRPGLNFFSIETSAPVPVVATLTHYDLYLGGGWTSGGVPFGLTNDLTSIPA